jgi:hypothetical protein
MIAALGHANWVEFIGPPLAVSDPLGLQGCHRAHVAN